ncbi:MAG: Fe-S cluster assembly ATPase SufC [Pseudomonadota bacterium]
MLHIKDLSAEVDGKEILKGVTLDIDPGEVHAIMGPNGSGKSTLSYVLAGRDGYERTGGSAIFAGNDLFELEPEERARLGVFLAFQYPVEIPGVTTNTFLRTMVNANRVANGQDEVDPLGFVKEVRGVTKELGIDSEFLKRPVNVGFSGGEKKRNEVLQMSLLQPRLAILDETDSGLDIDALKVVSQGVNRLRGPNFSALVITHYQRLLNHIVPDKVHIMAEGRIVRSGGPELAHELEAKGYADVIAEAA